MITMKHKLAYIEAKALLNLMTRSHFIEILMLLTIYVFDLGVRLIDFSVTVESVTLRFYCTCELKTLFMFCLWINLWSLNKLTAKFCIQLYSIQLTTFKTYLLPLPPVLGATPLHQLVCCFPSSVSFTTLSEATSHSSDVSRARRDLSYSLLQLNLSSLSITKFNSYTS